VCVCACVRVGVGVWVSVYMRICILNTGGDKQCVFNQPLRDHVIPCCHCRHQWVCQYAMSTRWYML